jgi:signal transduction histidine kinase
LGLYIVKEAIDKMKGQIEVQSEERKGTTFMLDIPNIQHIFLHQSNDITYST